VRLQINWSEAYLTLHDPAVRKNVLDKPIQPVPRGDDTGHMVLDDRVELVAGLVEGKVSKTDHGAEGSAHVVRDSVRKSFELSQCTPQMGGALANGPLQFLGLMGELVFGFVQQFFGLLAFSNIADIALDDLAVRFVIEIADDLELPAFTRFGVALQVIAPEKTLFAHLAKGSLALLAALEQPDLI